MPLIAVFEFLSYFEKTYTGKPLTASGNAAPTMRCDTLWAVLSAFTHTIRPSYWVGSSLFDEATALDFEYGAGRCRRFGILSRPPREFPPPLRPPPPRGVESSLSMLKDCDTRQIWTGKLRVVRGTVSSESGFLFFFWFLPGKTP